MLPVSTPGKQTTKRGNGSASYDDPNTASVNQNNDGKGEDPNKVVHHYLFPNCSSYSCLQLQ
jgi:hypothetical protein